MKTLGKRVHYANGRWFVLSDNVSLWVKLRIKNDTPIDKVR